MKNKNVIAVCAFLALAFASCKKDEAFSPSSPATPVKTSSLKSNPEMLRQKMIGLSDAATKQFIQNFKNSVDIISNSSATAKNGGIAFTNTIIPFDTAVFVLEATLNFDFDKGLANGNEPPTKVETVSCPSSFPVAIDANGLLALNSSDVVNAYNYFATQFANKNHGPNKIKSVDIVASLDPVSGDIHFDANLVLLTYGKPAYPYVPGCGPITQSATWSLMFSCSPPVPVDATVLCTNYLNCSNINGHGCYGGYVWYSNVSTAGWSGQSNAQPAALYWSIKPILQCDNTVLNAGQMNNYVAGCKALALASLPAIPNAAISNYNVTAGFIGTGTNWNNWWSLGVTYGSFHCSIAVQ